MIAMIPSRSLLDRLLELEAEQFTKHEIDEAKRELDRVTDRIACVSSDMLNEFAHLKNMVQPLFQDLSLCFSRSNRQRNFTFTGTLCDKQGNCLGLTTVFILLTQNCEVPIQPLLFESHIAACGLISGVWRPIEMIREGMIPSPRAATYLYRFYGHSRRLDENEFLAVHLSNRGVYYHAAAGRYKRGMDMLSQSIDLFPAYNAARINLAAILLEQGDLAAARKELETVLDTLAPGRYFDHVMGMLNRISGSKPHNTLIC